MTGRHICISPLCFEIWAIIFLTFFFSHNIRIELMEFLISDYVRSWISIEDFDTSR